MGLKEPEETALTFSGNAELKAWQSSKTGGIPALADDSGLSVDALDGRPGVHSARWAGPDRDFLMAMNKVNLSLQKLDKISGFRVNRAAKFICSLSLAWPDGHLETTEACVKGNIVWPPRGSNGFGYDPFFVPLGFNKTFAEINPKVKHSISHRALAFKKLLKQVFIN